MSYESPIRMIIKQFDNELIEEKEKVIMEACTNIGVEVSKTELIKALHNDRKQYEKGYRDAIEDIADDLKEYIDLKLPTYLHIVEKEE